MVNRIFSAFHPSKMPNPLGKMQGLDPVQQGVVYTDRIEKERTSRDIWNAKFGPEFIEKFRLSQKAGEEARKQCGLPSAYMIDNRQLNFEDLPKEMRKTKHIELEHDVYNLWNIDLEEGIYDKNKYKKVRTIWD